MFTRTVLLSLPLVGITLFAVAQEKGVPVDQESVPQVESVADGFVSDKDIDRCLSQDFSPLLWSGVPSLAERDPADELLHRRNWNTKQFRNDDGSVTAIISKGSFHYQDEFGQWREIRTDIRPNDTGLMEQYAYAVTENRHQVFISETVDGGYTIQLPEGEIVLGTQSELWIESVAGDMVLSMPRSSSVGYAVDNKMTYEGTYPLVSGYDELIVNKRGVKHNVVLEHRPLLLDAFGDSENLVLSEFVALPDGWSVVSADGVYFASTESVSVGSMLVIDEHGSPVAQFPTPVIRELETREIFHADGPKGPSTEYRVEKTTGSFRVEVVQGGVYVETLVPMSWLLDSDRVYPVVIDPGLRSICDSSCDIDDHTSWAWPAGEIYSSSNCANRSSVLEFRGNDVQQIYMFFRTYSIPDSATINSVRLSYFYEYGNYPYFKVRYTTPHSSTCNSFWWSVHHGTIYYDHGSGDGNHSDNTWYTRELLNGASADLQSHLHDDRFGLTIQETDNSSNWYGVIDSYDGTIEPFLTVGYFLLCTEDINGDGAVDVIDLLTVIDQWGVSDSPADVNADGVVDSTDLLFIIASWGPCI